MTVVACDQEAVPVHGVVAFVPADFRAMYPQFTDPPVTNAMLQNYFLLATLVINNSCASVVSDANEREQLLNLLVAHIATLVPIQPAAGAGSGVTIVGPVSSAAEGSVSITSGYAARVANNEAWFAQTQYGFLVWQLIAQYRTFRYVAPERCCGPAGAYAGRRGY